MKRFFTIAAAVALTIGVTLPAAAINPFVSTTGGSAVAAEGAVSASADRYQDVSADISAAATSARDSFASEAKPAPPPPPKVRFLASSYSGAVPNMWRGMMSNWPVPGAKIGDRFTGGHDGIDFFAAEGTAILATADGTVVKTGSMGTMGDMVEIAHNGSVISIYGHMIPGSQEVVAGQHVSAGQVIGHVGHSGAAQGNHCHYGIILNGRTVDPAPFLGL